MHDAISILVMWICEFLVPLMTVTRLHDYVKLLACGAGLSVVKWSIRNWMEIKYKLIVIVYIEI